MTGRRRAWVPISFLASALVVALAMTPLGASSRTVALACAGGALVGVAEVASRLAALRSWPTRPDGTSARVALATDLGTGVVVAVAGAAAGWITVVTGTVIGAGGWPILLAGGAGAIAVVTVMALFPAGTGQEVKPPQPPGPSLHGRPHGRGSTPARSGRQAR